MPGITGCAGVKVAEVAREGHVLLRAQVLAREEDHLVAQQRRAQLGDDVVGELLLEVDAAYLGSDRGGERRDVQIDVGRSERHETSLL